MIQGQSIVLYNRTVTGYNDFNEPIFTNTKTTVENCLIAPVSGDDIIDTHELEGRREVYTIALPKGDAHTWDNNIVEFWGKRWRVFGAPVEGMPENIPLSWNKKITVERIDGTDDGEESSF